MVKRRDFDARLVEVARARGAAVYEGEGVTRVESGKVTRVETNRGAYNACVVVGAESVVARQVGLPPPPFRRAQARDGTAANASLLWKPRWR